MFETQGLINLFILVSFGKFLNILLSENYDKTNAVHPICQSCREVRQSNSCAEMEFNPFILWNLCSSKNCSSELLDLRVPTPCSCDRTHACSGSVRVRVRSRWVHPVGECEQRTSGLSAGRVRRDSRVLQTSSRSVGFEVFWDVVTKSKKAQHGLHATGLFPHFCWSLKKANCQWVCFQMASGCVKLPTCQLCSQKSATVSLTVKHRSEACKTTVMKIQTCARTGLVQRAGGNVQMDCSVFRKRKFVMTPPVLVARMAPTN